MKIEFIHDIETRKKTQCMPCTEFSSWFHCTKNVFIVNTIIYRNINYLLIKKRDLGIYIGALYGLVFNDFEKILVLYFIDDILLLMLKLPTKSVRI
jgi:hypothetical protein